MTENRMMLTDKAVARLPAAAKGQYIVRDEELKGFFVVVGKKKKTYTVQYDAWIDRKRKTVRVALGSSDSICARDARKEALVSLGGIAKGEITSAAEKRAIDAGEDPNEVKAVGVTLAEAWERYRVALVRKGRSARTVESYRDHVERLFKSWSKKPLRELGDDPDTVSKKHDGLTDANGPYIANGAMRTLRAIYNHARKKDRSLPAGNPVDAIDWNEETRRNTGMGPRDLPAWFEELYALENPLRREFHLFSLLSGCRPDALKRAEVEHLDFRRRILHIPAPKGGAKKAFDIPLSVPMVYCLIRAIRLSRQMYPENATWIFAADSASGHMVEHKEDRAILSKWANDLRQSFRTCGQAALVPSLDVKILMNHALPGVNEEYITIMAIMEDHLRKQQEKISTVVFQAVANGKGKRREAILKWIGHGRLPEQLGSSAPADEQDNIEARFAA